MDEYGDILAEIDRRLEVYKEEFKNEFLRRWNQRTPVRTGVLQKGNGGRVNGDFLELSNDVPYFDYVENGTERMNPVGMLKTTILECPQISDIAASKARLDK